MIKAVSPEDYILLNSFESVRSVLLDVKFSDRMEKPLAYWALPNDRRLPLALLGKTVRELLAMPFNEISATPGIGQKKITSLVTLLHRAVDEQPQVTLRDDVKQLPHDESNGRARKSGGFDPLIVSEALWVQWRETVVRHNLGGEKLGRLTPSLQSLPTVIWNTPLSNYLNHTLAEIRQLKTYGEKRVRAVLEVFYVLSEVLAKTPTQETLAIRLVPQFIPPIESWIVRTLAAEEIPSVADVREQLVLPTLRQIAVDGGETVHHLAAGRLGVGSSPRSVRAQSRNMGVTRARIYQLLEDCAKMMLVRWPEGKYLLRDLAEKLCDLDPSHASLGLVEQVHRLYFPDKFDEHDEDVRD